MTENKPLPHIDLTAAPEALRQYAMEHLGAKIAANAKDETVRDRFKDIYFKETGIELAPIDEPEKKPAKKSAEKVAEKPQPIAVTINVQDDPLDPSPICGAVNFKSYRIMRNTDVRVSLPILESLRNAKRTIYDPENMNPKEVPMYPFSIVEHHFE